MMMMLMAMRVLSARTNMVIIRLAGDGHNDPNFQDHLQVLEEQTT
jgi:hypothetical protein